MCTPISPSTPTTTPCCTPPTARWRGSWSIARDLDGVISGEHGIGITKLEFLTEAELAAFRAYKQRVDPQGRFNLRKLLPDGDLRRAYTPSFALLGHESLIMQQSDIGTISDAIKDCLRCGKCKPVCATHVPRANLLYSARATRFWRRRCLIEAFLYEEQTRRGVSVRHWDEFADVADHCTVCHKCESPCPVDIDFGDVSMGHARPAAPHGQEALQCGDGRVHVLPERHQSGDHQADPHGDDRVGLQGAALGEPRPQTSRQGADQAAARHGGTPAGQGAGDPLRQQAHAGRPAEEDRARLARHRRPQLRADHPRPQEDHQRIRSGVLFSGLRLGAPVLAGRARDSGHAVARRRADRAAAGLPVLRLSATRRGRVRQGREDHHGQPRAVPPRRQYAELSRHQDRGGELRDLLRSASGLQIRGDLPRLQDHRHPRIPDGEERAGSRASPACATCITTPATRR